MDPGHKARGDTKWVSEAWRKNGVRPAGSGPMAPPWHPGAHAAAKPWIRALKSGSSTAAAASVTENQALCR